MKYKTTKKALHDNYHYIISVGYCNLQFLLNYKNADSYCTRIEGWACDNYDIDGVLISTGYAPIKEKNTTRNYEIIRMYEDKARAISTNYEISWEEQKAEVEKLLKEFVEESKVS